jgi:hypothetical protein
MNATVKDHNQVQIEHINRHKWYLSEKLGREVSFDEATLDWINNNYANEYREGNLQL